jgi:DNA-binding transcriptional regulator YiaG
VPVKKGHAMPNVAKVLKEEISRIARKEAKVAVASIRGPSVRARRDLADLKRRLALLERANRELQVRLAKIGAAQPAAPATETAARRWISGKGIRSLRKRLGLSQPDFARLVGASAQAVYVWESKPGMLKLREKTKAALLAAKGLGAKEARRQLAEKAPKKAAPRGKAKRRAK